MSESYKNIIKNLRKGIIDKVELGLLEKGLDQMMERIHFYENLIKERDEHIENLNNGIKTNNCKISEMRSHIDCLKAELAEVQMNKQELPLMPIDVASMLIKATVTCKTNPFQKIFNEGCPDEYAADRYSKADLKEIAKHLLVYCKNAEDI